MLKSPKYIALENENTADKLGYGGKDSLVQKHDEMQFRRHPMDGHRVCHTE